MDSEKGNLASVTKAPTPAAGTLFVATAPADERAVLLHWAVVSGFWSIPLRAGCGWPPKPTSSAALIFDCSWEPDVLLACRNARSRGVAPIWVLGADAVTKAPDIFGGACAEFICRPYLPEEAFIRIRRALSMYESRTPIPGLVLDDLTRECRFGAKSVALRPAEYAVLTRLMDVYPKAISHSQIVEDVLGSHGSGAAARNQVYELRRKLAVIGLDGIVRNSRGSGTYRIVVNPP